MSVVVFNWNYGLFLSELLKSFKPLINLPSVNLLILDDGSTDGSISLVDRFIEVNSAKNIFPIQFNRNNYGRKHPSFGQLEGLNYLLNTNPELVNDLVWLMDADDSFNFERFKELILTIREREADVFFLKMVDVEQNHEVEYKIKRKIEREMKIWPSVSPTSSLIISKCFIEKHSPEIFDFNLCYSDVWLDARINLLCMLKANVIYLPIKVYRNLHGGNDSLNSDLLRMLKKQLQSYRYMKRIRVKIKSNSYRLLFLRLLDVICK